MVICRTRMFKPNILECGAWMYRASWEVDLLFFGILSVWRGPNRKWLVLSLGCTKFEFNRFLRWVLQNDRNILNNKNSQFSMACVDQKAKKNSTICSTAASCLLVQRLLLYCNCKSSSSEQNSGQVNMRLLNTHSSCPCADEERTSHISPPTTL